MNPYLLLFSGYIMIFLEFFLPGAIMGIIGVILVLASVIIFGMQSSSSLYFALYGAGVLITLVLLFKFTLWRIKKSSSQDSFYSERDQKDFRSDSYDPSFIGHQAVAISDLRPAGRITVGGKMAQALSYGSFIAKGTVVMIIGGEGAAFVVKPHTEEFPQ